MVKRIRVYFYADDRGPHCPRALDFPGTMPFAVGHEYHCSTNEKYKITRIEWQGAGPDEQHCALVLKRF